MLASFEMAKERGLKSISFQEALFFRKDGEPDFKKSAKFMIETILQYLVDNGELGNTTRMIRITSKKDDFRKAIKDSIKKFRKVISQ